MRERSYQINFRATKTEKEKINADYIRNCALDKPVTEMPREGLQIAYRKVANTVQKLEQYTGTEEFTATLKSVQEILLDLYHGKEVDDDGCDEDLDGNG